MPPVPATETPDLNTVLQAVSRRAQALTGATGVAIALAHNESMICRASIGPSAPPLGCHVDVMSGFSGQCVRSGRTLRCDDSENDLRVDLASCRRLGIRSILAAPIRLKGQVIGIIEIFSPKPNAFDDRHVVGLRALAHTLFLSPLASTPTSPPKLLVETEPTLRIFFGNLIEALRSRAQAPVQLTSSPAQFWPDVFVSSHLRWQSFAESILLHIMMLVTLGSLLRLDLSHPRFVPPVFNRPDVVYYSPAEYVRPGRGKVFSATSKTQRVEVAKKIRLMPREQRSRTPTKISAPDIKLKGDIRVLHIIAWTSVPPSAPPSAVSRPQLFTPAALVDPVAPPPQVSGPANARALRGPAAAVIEPPPLVRGSFLLTRSSGIGPTEVISPAPQIPVRGPKSVLTTLEAGLRSALTSVVDPPPSLESLKSTDGPSIGGVPSATQIVPPPPQLLGLGNSNRSTHRGTPSAVVPPPPSLSGIENTSRYTRPLPLGASELLSADVAVRRESGTVENRRLDSNSSPAGQVDEEGSSGDQKSTSPREVSVAVIAAALPLASSSYFSSSETFIAEERLTNHRTRLIKLVYDFLPYQRRLSEYGPNYPDVDRLRVKRDVACDETLAQVMSGAGAQLASRPEEVLGAGYSGQPQTKMPCFRTTADDYRRARIHARK